MIKLWNKPKFTIVLVIALLSILYFWRPLEKSHLVHLSIASNEFERNKDQKLLNTRKQALVDYYTSVAYEHDVSLICKQAEDYFKTLKTTPADCILFDIDDTALYHYHQHDRLEFLWKHKPELMQARSRKPASDPAIIPVLKLYNALISMGFKIIFLSSRNSGSEKLTHDELIQAGYIHFHKLILMPDNLAFDRSIKTASWKLSIRKELAQHYNIVGSVGDREADFEGGYTGYKVKLPNYLY